METYSLLLWETLFKYWGCAKGQWSGHTVGAKIDIPNKGGGWSKGRVVFDGFKTFDRLGGFLPPPMTADNGHRKTSMATHPSRLLTVLTVLEVLVWRHTHTHTPLPWTQKKSSDNNSRSVYVMQSLCMSREVIRNQCMIGPPYGMQWPTPCKESLPPTGGTIVQKHFKNILQCLMTTTIIL